MSRASGTSSSGSNANRTVAGGSASSSAAAAGNGTGTSSNTTAVTTTATTAPSSASYSSSSAAALTATSSSHRSTGTGSSTSGTSSYVGGRAFPVSRGVHGRTRGVIHNSSSTNNNNNSAGGGAISTHITTPRTHSSTTMSTNIREDLDEDHDDVERYDDDDDEGAVSNLPPHQQQVTNPSTTSSSTSANPFIHGWMRFSPIASSSNVANAPTASSLGSAGTGTVRPPASTPTSTTTASTQPQQQTPYRPWSPHRSSHAWNRRTRFSDPATGSRNGATNSNSNHESQPTNPSVAGSSINALASSSSQGAPHASINMVRTPVQRTSEQKDEMPQSPHRSKEQGEESPLDYSQTTTAVLDASMIKPMAATAAHPVLVDGIPVHHLRSLATHALISQPTPPLPAQQQQPSSWTSIASACSQAVFFASLLYSKTALPTDGLLLARAHLSQGNTTASMRILEESGILWSEQPWQALLVAAAAMAAHDDWQTLSDVLEDSCRVMTHHPSVSPRQTNHYPYASTTSVSNLHNIPWQVRPMLAASPPLLDDDEIGWEALKNYVSIHMSDTGGDDNPTLTSSQQSLHPLASLCWWRGQAYWQLGNRGRAVNLWKRALRLDSSCQAAWQSLLQHHLLTSAQAHTLITEELQFAPHMTWLRALYLARLELTPAPSLGASIVQEHGKAPVSSTIPNDDALETVARTVNPPLNVPQAANPFSFGEMINLDASAIPFSSPIPNIKTPAMGGGGLDTMSRMDEDGGDDDTGNAHANQANAQCHDDVEQDEIDVETVTTLRMVRDVDTAFEQLWSEYKFNQAPEVLAMAARRAYRRYQWKNSLHFCESLALVDPTLKDAAFCYVSTLVLLGHKRTLFRLAHDWVEASPKSAQAWFAVGSYYYACQRYHVAQRHYCRATRLDPACTEAWIAFGCAFAACDESDQALASFRAAQRLSPAEHSSLLYMGMEYVRTNHLVLAQYFLQAALTSSGGDPLCFHELGVLAFHKGNFNSAIVWFQRALAAVYGTVGPNRTTSGHVMPSLQETLEMCSDPYWEPTIFNLGHALRKQGQWQGASWCFARCMALCPSKASTYAAAALTEHLQWHLDAAINLYHQALSLQPDDPICTGMLAKALYIQATEALVPSKSGVPMWEQEPPTMSDPGETGYGKLIKAQFSSTNWRSSKFFSGKARDAFQSGSMMADSAEDQVDQWEPSSTSSATYMRFRTSDDDEGNYDDEHEDNEEQQEDMDVDMSGGR